MHYEYLLWRVGGVKERNIAHYVRYTAQILYNTALEKES